MIGRIPAAPSDQDEASLNTWDDADARYREACNYLYDPCDLEDEGGEAGYNEYF